MKKAPVTIAAATLIGSLWFGTDESHTAALDAIAQVKSLEAVGGDALKNAIQMRSGSRDDPFSLPPMMEVHGDTGVVAIRGSLVHGAAGFFRLFGLTGYEDIKDGIAAALENKDVKRIVLDISSGGGAVDGVVAAGEFIRKAAAIKPVIAYASGAMGSAAYWLGSSADLVFASSTSMVGSVGTLIVQMEMTGALEKEGRKANIFRNGEYKALGHPYEKLSAKGEEAFQYLADASGKIFVEYAAERRGTTPEKFQKTMGEGRVFVGADAQEVGLIDGVMSFEELLANAKTLDKRSRTAENSRQSAKDPAMKVRAISKAVILAILGGTKVEALGLGTEAANVTGEKPEAEDVTALTAEAAEVQAAFTAAAEKVKTEAVTAATEPLKKQVTDLTAKVALLEGGAADLTGKTTAANELAASYAGIVKASIATMAVPLGIADTSAALAGEALLAEHKRVQDLFVAKFPNARVSAAGGVPSPEDNKTKAAVPSPEFLAAAAAWTRTS